MKILTKGQLFAVKRICCKFFGWNKDTRGLSRSDAMSAVSKSGDRRRLGSSGGLIVLHYSACTATTLQSVINKTYQTHGCRGRRRAEMSTQTAALDSQVGIIEPTAWRNRTVAIVLALAICGFFWIDSRYPSLLKKYRAGSHVKVVGVITFDAVYPVDRTMPFPTRVWRTTVNWLHANEIGMTFGFFFAAAALTFLATIPRRRTGNAYLNSLIGVAAGMPLGVCSNCVAPIGRALYASGMSTESVLAAMFSSPTLNVVVLAMVFTLFPLAVAAAKMITVLLMVFVVGPFLGKQSDRIAETACVPSGPVSTTWREALVSTAKMFATSFWKVFKVAAPLMVIAALLGAVVIELVPPNALHVAVTLLGIVLVALIGTFLPVPMAFDVVLAYVAMSGGVPLPYVVVLLCTLGIYSVYSFSVVGKTICWRVAAGAFAGVVVLGVLAGIVTMLS